jgi:hypothetical protein
MPELYFLCIKSTAINNLWVLFYGTVSIYIIIASNRRTTREWLCWTKFEEAVVVKLRCHFGICLKGRRKTTKILSRDSGLSAMIRTEHLPNRNLRRYRYANLLAAITIYTYKSKSWPLFSNMKGGTFAVLDGVKWCQPRPLQERFHQ